MTLRLRLSRPEPTPGSTTQRLFETVLYYCYDPTPVRDSPRISYDFYPINGTEGVGGKEKKKEFDSTLKCRCLVGDTVLML